MSPRPARLPDYEAPAPQKLVIHLTNGRILETLVDDIEHDSDLFKLVSGAPHWQRLGGLIIYTQNIAGLELG